MLIAFQEKEKGGRKGEKKNKKKNNINIAKQKFQKVFSCSGWGNRSQTVLCLQYYRWKSYELLLYWDQNNPWNKFFNNLSPVFQLSNNFNDRCSRVSYMKKNQNHHNSFLVIYQKNRGIVEHKCNLDDISIKIQCFSNADRLSE